MKKKIISLALVVAMLAIAVVGGTLAYFTDEDEATNTFTVGSVEIDLLESELHRTNDSATDDQIIADDLVYDTSVENIMPGQWIKKAPYVLNTGKNDAYVRVRVIFEKDEAESLYFMETTTAQEDGSIVKTWQFKDADGNVVGDNTPYASRPTDYATLEYTFTYTEALAPNEMTYWPAFWQYCVKNGLDQDDIAGLELDKIVVEADAIQAETFDTAADAFAAFDAE